MLNFPIDKMWLGTFHSLCARILRFHYEDVGLKSNFIIIDSDDQLKLLKQIWNILIKKKHIRILIHLRERLNTLTTKLNFEFILIIHWIFYNMICNLKSSFALKLKKQSPIAQH